MATLYLVKLLSKSTLDSLNYVVCYMPLCKIMHLLEA